MSQISAKVLAAEAQRRMDGGNDAVAHHSDEDDPDEEQELFEAFDPYDDLESQSHANESTPVPGTRGAAGQPYLKWAKMGTERPNSGSEIKSEALAAVLKNKLVLRKDEWDKLNLGNLAQDCYVKVADCYLKPAVGRVFKYREKLGAAAIMDGRQDDVSRAKRLEADEAERRLPTAGLVLEQVAPAELKVKGMSGQGTLYSNDQTSNRNRFDGLLLPESLPQGDLASGLTWTKMTHLRPTYGRELTNPELVKALASKTKFTKQEWDGIGVEHLRADHFIKSGGFYFRPVDALENVQGLSVLIYSDGRESERVGIQKYDVAKRCLVFEKSINVPTTSAVGFEIWDVIEYEVVLRGALSTSQVKDKHWALKKSALEYLEVALLKCLHVTKDQVQIIVKASSPTNDIRAVLRLESPSSSSTALMEALSREVSKGNITAVAQQNVREEYLKILDRMRMSALYTDTEFPPSAVSIWGGRSKRGNISENIKDGVQWLRPPNLLQNIQAKEQIMQGVVEQMMQRSSLQQPPSQGTASREDVSSELKRLSSSENSKLSPGAGTRALKVGDIGSRLTSGLKWQKIGATCTCVCVCVCVHVCVCV